MDWCFLGGSVPTKRDYGWAQQQGQKPQSLDYYQQKYDNTPGCTGFAWRGDQAPYWYYTGNNFTTAAAEAEVGQKLDVKKEEHEYLIVKNVVMVSQFKSLLIQVREMLPIKNYLYIKILLILLIIK